MLLEPTQTISPTLTYPKRTYHMRRFVPSDFRLFTLQAPQAKTEYHVPEQGSIWAMIAAKGTGYTGFRDGLCIGCAGIVPEHPQLAYLWCQLAETCDRRDLLWITRTSLAFLAKVPFRRLQCVTSDRFDRSSRWAELLGFTRESVMKAYCPDGSDAYMYVRFKG